MIDENAFGLLVSYFDIEDDEYSLEREEFVERFRLFREVVLQGLVETRAGAAVRAVDLGHVIYWELAQEDDMQDPIGWLRTVRERLARQSFATVGGGNVNTADASYATISGGAGNLATGRISTICVR